MRNGILGVAGLIAIVLFLSLPAARCTKTTETKHDTTIITTVVQVDTSVNLSKGLLVYYPFNNSVADSSGNKRNGTVSGSLQYTTDKNNNPNAAAQFDGTSAYILLKDSGSLSPASFTICAQLYATTTTHENVFSKINFTNSNSISWGLALFGGAPGYANSASFGVRGNAVACGQFDPMGYSDLVYSMVDILPNQWYHVTCVFDKGVEKIYLNGTLRNAITRSFTTPKQCTEASIVLGAWWQSDLLLFKGKMDEFRMYNRALNDVEIAQLGKGF